MDALGAWHWSEWDTRFYASDCSESDLSFLGMGDFSLTFLLSLYTAFALFCAYAYGRHKGLAKGRVEALIQNKNARSRLIELSSKIWFVLSMFLFPWSLSAVWLFYSVDDIHYVNAFNPWLLSVTVIYALYSALLIASYAIYSNANKCASLSLRLTLAYALCLALFALYILRENSTDDAVEGFSVDGFHGAALRHCVDLGAHRNPLLLGVFAVLYASLTHHLFVALRVATAKCCGGEYIEKTLEFYSQREKRKRRRQRRRQRRQRRHEKEYDPDDGTQYEYDSDSEESKERQRQREQVPMARILKNKRDYLASPSDSMARKEKYGDALRVRPIDLEISLEHGIPEAATPYTADVAPVYV